MWWRKDRDLAQSAEHFRAAAEVHLAGPRVKAASLLRRTDTGGDSGEEIIRSAWRFYERLSKGRVGRLPESFLLAVTEESVYAFDYRGRKDALEVREEVEVFDRGEIRLRADAMGYLFLDGVEAHQTHTINLDGKLAKTPGAAEVIAALSE